MIVKHMLSLADVGPEQLSQLVAQGVAIAGERHGPARWRPLEGKTVGIYFKGASTRTRTSFTVAALRLGAGTIAYGPDDLQLSTGETIEDTARVLSGFLDALVIRTNGSMDEMRAFASQGRMAVVNAMSETEHPTQAIADLVTMKEAFGRLQGLHLLYLGEGNNTASALALAVAMTRGMRLTLVTPDGYGLPRAALELAEGFCRESGSIIEQHHDETRLPYGVDVVYTTRWQTMGAPKADHDWKEKFAPYSVTSELMARVSKPSGTIFMHDLPAVRGEDTADEVLDGPQSLAFRQAEHKLTAAMSVLAWCAAAD
jgi:ornithine carbamoyltransferase